jgi:predicted PurR-regulated permease PerM
MDHVRHTVDISPRALGKIIGAVFCCWLLVRLWPVLVLVLLSLMLVATFNPLVRNLERRFASRSLSIMTVLVLMILAIAGILALLVPVFLEQGYHLLTRSPVYAQQIHDALHRYHIRVDVVGQVNRLSARMLNDLPSCSECLGLRSRAWPRF